MKIFQPPYFGPALHILIWALLLGIPTLLVQDQHFLGLSHDFFLITSIYHIGIFYLNVYFLYPRLLTRKRWPLYILSFLLVVILSFRIKLLLLRLDPAFVLTAQNTRIIFFGIVPFIIGGIIFRLISDRIFFEKLEKEARAEHLASELKFLRSQVSPHFLFNMLANMVALARQKSDLLEPSLIKLSELLRYMLYDSAEEKIPVGREIEQLENYIALQHLRFGEDVRLELDIRPGYDSCVIEPMLLIPFIENAFKHGIGMVEDPYIRIYVEVKDRLLNFTISNNYNSSDLSKDKNSGIGLVNVRNRLDLLYPGKYELSVVDEQQVFSIQLKLDLS